jgi:hypothetical protein
VHREWAAAEEGKSSADYADYTDLDTTRWDDKYRTGSDSDRVEPLAKSGVVKYADSDRVELLAKSGVVDKYR